MNSPSRRFESLEGLFLLVKNYGLILRSFKILKLIYSQIRSIIKSKQLSSTNQYLNEMEE